jgi:hypothetical protein
VDELGQRDPAPKLTAADVELLLAEATELQLDQIEIEQVLEKLEEAKVWAQEAATLLSSGRSVGELAMVQLLDLQARAEQIPIALEQLAVLEERVTRLQSWQARAKTALDARNVAELPRAVRALVAEAAELGISLGDLAHLSSHLAYHTWGEQATKALKTTVPLQRLQTLCEQSEELSSQSASPLAGLAETLQQLRDKLQQGREWRDKLAAEEAEGRLSLKEATALQSEAESVGVTMPEAEALRGAITRAREWNDTARKVSTSSTRGGAARPSLPELKELLAEGEALPVAVLECAVLAQQVKEAEEWYGRAERAITKSDGGAEAEAKDAAMVKELKEVQRQGEVLMASVSVGRTLNLRLWRMQCRIACARAKGGLLKELQQLDEEGESLHLGCQIEGELEPPEGADSAAGAAGEGGAAAKAEEVYVKPRSRAQAAEAEATSGGTVALRDGERERAEHHSGQAEWRALRALVSRAQAWQAKAEAVLTTQRVRVEDMEALLEAAKELPVALEEREWISVNLEEAREWLETASRLEAPAAPLEDLQKLLKEYAKVNLLSTAVAPLRARAAQGESWLAESHTLFNNCGIELGSLRRILETDGAELYCACRQPDDLQRLMIGCDHCPVWYHINCMGVSSAKAKALGEGTGEYMCPACCQAQGVKYAFTPRVLKAPPKKLPSTTRVAELITRADALSVKVEEARLLRNALARCRGWQRALAPRILATFLAGGGGGLAGALRAEQLDEWLG